MVGLAASRSWRRAWPDVIPFYAFPGEVRRILYTTNTIEALNASCAGPFGLVAIPDRRGGQ